MTAAGAIPLLLLALIVVSVLAVWAQYQNALLRSSLQKLQEEHDRLYQFTTDLSTRYSVLRSERERSLETQGELDAPPLRCRFGHEHPPEGVTAATHNPTNQPRPFHCPSCREANRWDKTSEHWVDYALNDVTRMRLHPEPCAVCFPAGFERT